MWVRRPYQTHGTCDYPSHAEAEQHAGHEKLPAAALVDLEDGHMRGRAHGEKHQEHGCDGAVEARGGLPAQARCPRGVGSVLRDDLWREEGDMSEAFCL